MKNMKTNESVADRWVRAVLGAVILYLSYGSLGGVWQIVGYVVGIVLILTAITGFCLLYALLDISTKK
jgi:hypothetical protein